MNRTRLGQLEKRKSQPLEALEELAAAAVRTPADLRPRLLAAAALALGRMGLLEAGAEIGRRALDLAAAAGNYRAGRRILRHLDALEELRPPWRIPELSRMDRRAAREASARLREALELPDLSATTRAELDDLDELRYERPEAAICRLLPAADRLPEALVVRWLGVTGSAYRLRAGQREEIEADLSRAHGYLKAALWMAQKAGDVAGQADVLQRLGYVLSDRGDHRQALELAERAGGIYDRIGDRAGRGKALVDQGMKLYYLGMPRRAIDAQRQALELLPNSERRNRIAAFQHLSFFHAAVKDWPRAETAAARAREHAVPDSAAAGRLLWLQASIECQIPAGDSTGRRRRLAAAASHYGQALEILRRVHYADAALVTVELVRVLMLLGRHEEAHRVALTVRELVIPLQRNRHVSAALAELIRGGREVLTIARVERVRNALERARRRPDWRSLKVR